ncbi:MAG: molybdopterin-binding protein, partial [Pseudomonadota bacterium]
AQPAVARRANPPVANAAVDGFALAGAGVSDGSNIMTLARGRAAAGAPFDGVVQPGEAVRILTGAALPAGVDTVVLEEDCTIEAERIAFNGPLKVGANARKAGEDAHEGDTLLDAGHRLRPQDLAFLTATGVHDVAVHRRLRVGVLSTGDEIRAAGTDAAAHEIWDANRPMLLAQVRRWGFEAHDLGHVSDDRSSLRTRLDTASGEVDAILTSGGASAGDEDHVSALLNEAGSMSLWRIAVKPGRPLALGVWHGVPVFGLPGNPVAAFVCALTFAAPALRLLGGGGFVLPRALEVPAAFH